MIGKISDFFQKREKREREEEERTFESERERERDGAERDDDGRKTEANSCVVRRVGAKERRRRRRRRGEGSVSRSNCLFQNLFYFFFLFERDLKKEEREIVRVS